MKESLRRVWSHLSAPESPPLFDRLPIAALLTVAVVLVVQDAYGDQPTFRELYPDGSEMGGFRWWVGARILGYFVVPFLVALAVRAPFSQLGVGLGDTLRHAWIYAALFGCVLPFVFLASRAPSFIKIYPFYRGPHQLEWELEYGATFVALEFFFRGFALQWLRRVMGPYAVFVMVVPYAMIHVGKPLPEILGAIVAGILLGAMALLTRSIWGGVAVHLGVAWTMDLLALTRR